LTPCFTYLRLAQQRSTLACSSYDAPQSPWGKLQSSSNKDPITASATAPSLYRKQPHCHIPVQRASSHHLWLWHGRLQQKRIIAFLGMCLMPHSLSEVCMASKKEFGLTEWFPHNVTHKKDRLRGNIGNVGCLNLDASAISKRNTHDAHHWVT
jgi:hypothetical protein